MPMVLEVHFRSLELEIGLDAGAVHVVPVAQVDPSSGRGSQAVVRSAGLVSVAVRQPKSWSHKDPVSQYMVVLEAWDSEPAGGFLFCLCSCFGAVPRATTACTRDCRCEHKFRRDDQGCELH